MILVSSLIMVLLEVVAIMAKFQRASSSIDPSFLATAQKYLQRGQTQLGKSYTKMNLIGYIITVIIIWGLFLYQLSQIGWDTDSIAFDIILIYTIITTIIETVLFLISLIFPVGTIIIMIYGIIEAILAFLSLFWEVDTIQETVIQAIIDVTYNIDYMIANFAEADRLEFDTDYRLLDTTLGYIHSNSLLYTMTITNTIVATNTFTNQSTNTFDYVLQESATDQHSDLDINQMNSEWVLVEDVYTATVLVGGFLPYTDVYDGARMTETVVITLPFSNAGQGVNQSIPTFYLTEAYALAVRGCWQFIWEDCTWESIKGSNHMEMDYLIFDILPDTLQAFVELDWSGSSQSLASLTQSSLTATDDAELTFPDQIDQDGDGLLNALFGGVDPDDTQSDIDDDGLSDSYELSYGYDPEDADSDNDGLTDAEEAYIYFTDPEDDDTDDDGLTDYLELVQGWLVSYTDANGATQVTRVWSSPFYTDYDDDGLSDLQEFTFSFHPQVDTDPSAIANIIQFDNIGIEETDTPHLFLKMEENDGESVFADVSGEGNNGTCDWTADSCPTAGVDGIYGEALEFDGLDDEVVISDTTSLNFGAGSFTAAAWVKSDDFGDWQNIVSKKAGGGTAVGWTLRLDPDNKATMFVADGSTAWWAGGNTDLVVDQWVHVAGVVDSEQDEIRLYVDGSLINTLTDYTGTVNNTEPVIVGSWVNNGNKDYFDGTIDEVLLYDHALSTAEIVEVMNGRYDTNDLFVRAGAKLTYQATVTNSNTVQPAHGFLIGQSDVVTPSVPSPMVAYNFDQAQRAAYFVNNNGEENSVYCLIATCPTSGAAGSDGNAVQFDGDDDYIIVPTLLQEAASSFEIDFDIYLNSLPSSGERMYILDTTKETTGALDIYIDDTGTMIFDVQGDNDSADRPEIDMNSSTGSWHSISIDTNGNYSNWDPDTTTLGNGRLGNSLDGTGGLDATIDDFITHSDGLESDIRYKFEKVANYDGTIFYDGQSDADHGTCSGDSCPTVRREMSGNRFLEFDGINDTFYLDSSNSLEEFTLSWDMHINGYPSSPVSIFESNTLDITFNSSGQILVERSDGYNNTSSNSVPLNQWVTVSITYDEYWESGNCKYDSTITFDSTSTIAGHYSQSSCSDHSLAVGNGTFGSTDGSSNFFAGALDNISLVIATYDFDPATSNISYVNLVTDRAESSCEDVFSCPDSTTGYFNEGLYFDGVEKYMNLGPILDPAAGDFTVALWFNSENDFSDYRRILHQQDGTGSGTVWLGLNIGTGQTYSWLEGGWTGGGFPTPNTWHHVALVYENDTLYLYLDGDLQNSRQLTPHASDGDLILGREADNDDNFFIGEMDELVILDTALSPEGIQFLMNNQWPVVEIPDKFVTFSAAASSTTVVSGTASVNSHATSSVSQFDQEIEAALEIQNGALAYPNYSNVTDTLDLFLPFDDAPGSTSFKNLVAYTYNVGTNYGSFDPSCSGDSCPTAGLRGIVGRALYFDGLDDYLTVDLSEVYQFGETAYNTISVWVNAKQGTILDSRNGYGTEIDMYQIHTTNASVTADFPRDEWFHLVIVDDDPDGTGSRVYVNGALYASTNDEINGRDVEILTLGRNYFEGDYLEGYLDDLRIYNVDLSASEVLTLYQESAPVFRFEFDEESIASNFVDGVNAYVGTPDYETCTTLTLDSLTLNSADSDTAHLYLAVDGEWLIYDPISDYSVGVAAESNVSTVICDDTTISGGVVDDSGTAVSLGTLNTIITNTGVQTDTFTAGSDSLTLNYTIDDDLIYQPNPIPGTDGQIGNTALFDGNGIIELTDTTVPLNLSDADFTIMAWVKTDKTGTGLLVKTDGDGSWESGEKAFYIDNDGYPAFVGWGNAYIKGSTPLTDTLWHHVTVVWDYDGSGTSGTGKMYVDGLDVTSTDSYSAANADNSNDTLKIGDSNRNSNEAGDIFEGQLDELTAYRRALSAGEIYNIYLLELRWYRDQATANIIIDEDTPTIEMLSTYEYRADGYIQLVATAEDATSGVSLVQFGLKAPGEITFTWDTAVACTDSAIAYCPAFISSGEGLYEVQFRAVDRVGHETTSAVYTYTVDVTPPQSSGGSSLQLNRTKATIPFTIVEHSSRDWTITFSGTVSDPDVDSHSGSGVDESTIQVTLYDGIGDVLGTPNQVIDSFANDQWTVNYRVEDTPPVGVYTVSVTVEDEVGNATTEVIGTIKLDEQQTDTQVMSLFLPEFALSGTLPITGVVYDYPAQYGKHLDLHFDEAASTTRFYDYSGQWHFASCTNCPTSTTDTPFGRALDLDGLNDALVISDTIFLDEMLNDNFTIALWLKPDSHQATTGAVDNTILAKWSGSDGYPYAIRYLNQTHGNQGHISVNRYDGSNVAQIVSSQALNDGAFHHITFIKEGDTLFLYIDGQLDGTTSDTTTASTTNNDSPVYIGQRGNSSQHYFGGVLDELVILDYALTEAQVYALAQSGVNGVGQVEWALEEITDLTSLSEQVDESAQTWQTAVLDQSNSGASEWTFTIPHSGMESYYQVHLRSDDASGNAESAGTIWRGLIDQVAPTVVASGQYMAGYPFAETEYTFTFSDFILHDTTFSHPCAVGDVTSLTYNDVTLPQDGLPYQVSGSCRVDGHEASRTFTACDGAGNCTHETVMPDPAAETQLIELAAPAHNSAITATGAVTISGKAFASGGLQTIAVQVNDTTVDILSYGGTVSGTVWSTGSWLPTTAGVYTITAVLTDTFNNSVSDSHTVTIGIGDCFTEYTGDNVTDFASIDALAVQNAISAAKAGDVIKVAGNCAGTQMLNGLEQTIYITQSLTIQGGYQVGNWLASPTKTLTTTLDAQGVGRVIEVVGNVDVTLDHLKITGGNINAGGGIYLNANTVLTLTNSLVTANQSSVSGGGLFGSVSTIIISNTTFSYNQSGLDGGAIRTGGGTLALANSTLHHNEASDVGGAIYTFGTVLTLTNSTLSHNQGHKGGVIFTHLFLGSVALIHSTIVSNTADNNWYGGLVISNSLSIHNTILAHNDRGNCRIAGTIITATHNLDSDNSCGFTDSSNINSTDPMLGPLTDNGGDTQTHLPSSTSDVVDAIPAVNCATNSDQRGVSRPQGVRCDIGAVEVEADEPPISPTLTISLVGNAVQLDWSDATANCSYTVYRSSSPYSGFVPWQNNLNVLTITDPDGANNSLFYYVEATACSGGTTAVSNTVTTFPFALTPGD